MADAPVAATSLLRRAWLIGLRRTLLGQSLMRRSLVPDAAEPEETPKILMLR